MQDTLGEIRGLREHLDDLLVRL